MTHCELNGMEGFNFNIKNIRGVGQGHYLCSYLRLLLISALGESHLSYNLLIISALWSTEFE